MVKYLLLTRIIEIEPAPNFDDADSMRALHDRELAIPLRAELLVDQAIENGELWIQELGKAVPGDVEQWRKRAVTVACYRDLYGVTTDDALGREYTHARIRQQERAIASAALDSRLEPTAEPRAREPYAQLVSTATPVATPAL